MEATARLSDDERISEEPDVLPSSGIDEEGGEPGLSEDRDMHSDVCMQCDWSHPH